MAIETISTILLSDVEGTAPGPIHTLVSDPEGNLYYSDEMNHQVVSTDPEGRVRWRRGGKGSEEGQFHYPRGLALGRLDQAGWKTACVAICDSWNRRVQLFGLNGDRLTVWSGSGIGEFQEVVDIRFLAPGLDSGSGPDSWLILDRGAHKIRLHDDTGESLGAIGSVLPGHLEPSWAHRLVSSITCAALDGNESDLRFDPLYYPTRLFGDTPDALLVWEPLARQLKQIVGRNLLALGRFPGHPWECIAADRTGYLCWAPADGRIAAFGYDGEVELIAGGTGHPVSGGTAHGEVWFQDGSKLMRLRWHGPAASILQPGSSSPLCKDVVRELEQLRTSAELQEAMSSLLQAIDTAVGQCRQLWNASCNRRAGSDTQAPREAEIVEAGEVLRRRADQLEAFFSRQSPVLLKALCLQRAEGRSKDGGHFAGMLEIWGPLADSLNRRFSQAQELRDWICVSRVDPHVPGHGAWQESLQLLEDNLEKILQLLASEVQAADRYLRVPLAVGRRQAPSTGVELPGQPVCPGPRPAMRMGSAGGCLREVDRISLGAVAPGSKAGPYGLTTTSDNHVFVVLRLARQIIELSPEGKVLGRGHGSDDAVEGFEPLCVAADARDRLWVTECQKHRVRVFERGSGHGQIIGGEGSSVFLNYPHGISRGSDSLMLVADTGNHRILSLSDEGVLRIRAGGMGKEPGRLLHPMAVFPDRVPDGGMIWVVDHRNHRIQKFDAAGASASLVGSCGLRNGDLLLPHDAALSADGRLVVVQHLFRRCLKLFTQDGRELACKDLDFSPGCIRTHGDTLWVTDADGDFIRVYELD